MVTVYFDSILKSYRLHALRRRLSTILISQIKMSISLTIITGDRGGQYSDHGSNTFSAWHCMAPFCYGHQPQVIGLIEDPLSCHKSQ